MKAGTTGTKDPWNEGAAKPKIYETARVLRANIFLISHECDLPDGLREVIRRATNGESPTQNEIRKNKSNLR